MRLSPLTRNTVAVVLLAFSAIAVAQIIHWKLYDYTDEGFIASFPSLPDVQKKSVDAPGGPFELRTYSAGAGDSTVMVGICDYGPVISNKSPDQVLLGAKNSMLANSSSHLVNEKNIALDKHPGIEFEARSESTLFRIRLYLVETTLYQVLVASPVNKPFGESTRFLDSFELVKRTKYEAQD